MIAWCEQGRFIILGMPMQLYNNWLCMVLLQELFKRLPRQKKLSSYEKDVEQLLSVKANKKMIADKVANKSGKVVLLKDITNVSSAMKAGKSRNDLEETVWKLTEEYGNFTILHAVSGSLYTT